MRFSPDLQTFMAEMRCAPNGLTLNQVYQDPDLGIVKIRAYSSEEEAIRFEKIIGELKETIHIPHLWGRWNQYLVFEYLSLSQNENQELDENSFAEIGKTLGYLNRIEVGSFSIQELDSEFSGWMQRFQKLKLIPKRTAENAVQFYLRARPQDTRPCWDYWDAMPHNFGWADQEFFMLDEKHLRPSFFGVGLVKPYFLLESHQWKLVRQGFESMTSLERFERFRNFLEFYYLAAALFFYSLAIEAGRIFPIKNQRYLDYRDEFIRRADGSKFIAGAVGDQQLISNHPRYAHKIILRRMKKGFRANYVN